MFSLDIIAQGIINISVAVITGLIVTWRLNKIISKNAYRVFRRDIAGLIGEINSGNLIVTNEKEKGDILRRLDRIRDQIDLISGLWSERYLHEKRVARSKGEAFPYKNKKEFRVTLTQ